MKDAYEVLYQKESDLARVRQEVESLRVAASLLSDDTAIEGEISGMQDRKPAENAFPPESETQATGTHGTLRSSRQPRLWEAFTRKRR